MNKAVQKMIDAGASAELARKSVGMVSKGWWENYDKFAASLWRVGRKPDADVTTSDVRIVNSGQVENAKNRFGFTDSDALAAPYDSKFELVKTSGMYFVRRRGA